MITWDAYPAVPACTKLNPQTGRLDERPAEPPAPVKKLLFDPSGRRLLSVPESRLLASREVIQDPIRLWETTGSLIRDFIVDRKPFIEKSLNAAFVPDGDRLIVARTGHQAGDLQAIIDGHCVVEVWNSIAEHLMASATTLNHLSDIVCLPDGRMLIATSKGEIFRLSADFGEPVVPISGWKRTSPKASRLAVSPSGDRFAGVGRSRATVWSDDGTALASRVHAKSPHHGPASFRPDSTVLAVGHGTVVDLWDYANGKEQTLIGHKRPVWAVGFSPDGRTAAYTAASDGMMIAWDADSATIRQRYDFGTGKLYCAAVSPDGLTMALGGSDGRITVVDLEG